MPKLTAPKLIVLSFLLLFAITIVNATPAVIIPSAKSNSQAVSTIIPGSAKNVSRGSEKAQFKKEIRQFRKESASAKSPGKSKILAAVLAFFLGGFGVHRFYMGQKGVGFAQLGGTVTGIVLYVVGIAGYVSGGGESFPVLALIGLILILGVSLLAFIDFIRILTGGLAPEEGFDN